VPTNDRIKTGTTETEVIPGPDGDVTVEKSRGSTWKGPITATDPRFTGTHYATTSGINYQPPSEEGQRISADGHRIENDEGAWHGSGFLASLADGTERWGPVFLTGEGAYAGLTAVLFETEGTCFLNFRGVLMDVPEPPVPYTGD
jgi:hypothetical protein